MRMIREAGATEVHFRVSSPPVTHPCYYGIDMPTHDELLALAMIAADRASRQGGVAQVRLQGSG